MSLGTCKISIYPHRETIVCQNWKPTAPDLPSAADLDAHAEEERIRLETSGTGQLLKNYFEEKDARQKLEVELTYKNAIIAQWEASKNSGCFLIVNERARQIVKEVFTPEHDDTHSRGEMMSAAQDYIAEAKRILRDHEPIHDSRGLPFGWPWEASWWKPSPDPIRNLVKAGALLAAEIDLLQRLELKKEGQ